MYTVYILKSGKDKKRYIGMTKDIERRQNEHYNGNVKSTKNRRPIKLIYTEGFEIKKDAMLREKFFKTGKGREFLKNIEKRRVV